MRLKTEGVKPQRSLLAVVRSLYLTLDTVGSQVGNFNQGSDMCLKVMATIYREKIRKEQKRDHKWPGGTHSGLRGRR